VLAKGLSHRLQNSAQFRSLAEPWADIGTSTGRLMLAVCGGRRPSHGPYWYAYWKEDGRTRSSYIGTELPEAS
jgi:hypothetical protein